MRRISLPSPQKATQVAQIPIGTYQIVNLHTGAYAGVLNDNDRSEVVNLTLGLDGHGNRGSIVCYNAFIRDLHSRRLLDSGESRTCGQTNI